MCKSGEIPAAIKQGRSWMIPESEILHATLKESDSLKKIDEKKYDTDLVAAGVSNIQKIGIAFRGKNAVVKK